MTPGSNLPPRLGPRSGDTDRDFGARDVNEVLWCAPVFWCTHRRPLVHQVEVSPVVDARSDPGTRGPITTGAGRVVA